MKKEVVINGQVFKPRRWWQFWITAPKGYRKLKVKPGTITLRNEEVHE